MKFTYAVNIDTQEPIMLIDKHIGHDSHAGFGIMGDVFQRELLALDQMGKKRIQVWINSPGGMVSDGYNIYNAILKSNTKVDTYCMGLAASIAGVIFQAGRKRIMCDYGVLMYHNPYTESGDEGDGINAIKDSLVAMIAGRCGKSSEDVSSMMNKTSFISASDAFSGGLCDEIEYSNEYNKRRKQPETVMAYWKESNIFINKIINKTGYMNIIATKLNLGADATEEQISQSIDGLNQRIADMQSTIDAMNSAKEAAIAMERKNKAKDLVSGFFNESDAIFNSWVEIAENDFDKAKNLLEAIPINKPAAKLEPVVEAKNQSSFSGVQAILAKKFSETK